MKYINSLLSTLIIIFLFSLNANASFENVHHPDTIRMHMPNGTTIEYKGTYNEKSTLVKTFKIKEQLSDFLNKWYALNVRNMDSNKSYKITCTSIKKYMQETQLMMDIQEQTFNRRIIFPNDKTIALSSKGRNQLILNPEFSIHFDSIEQLIELTKMDLNQILQNSDKVLLKNEEFDTNKTSFNAWMNIKKDHSVSVLDKRNLGKYNNQILLQGGTSIENVGGDWNGGLYLNTTLFLTYKGAFKHAFKIEYEWTSNFSSDNSGSNNWLNVGYARNLSANPNKTNWLGLNIGYLISGPSNNSFRIGVNKRIHKNISVEPQIHFEDFFYGVQSGIKLKINL